MVGRDYLLHKPKPPSHTRVVIDQHLVPLAANGAGALERALERLATGTRHAPIAVISVAVLLGLFFGAAHRRKNA